MRAYLLIGIALLLADCGRAATSEDKKPGEASAVPYVEQASEAQPPAEAEHISLPTRVRLSDQVLQRAGIASSPVRPQTLPVTVDLTGEIAFDPDRAAHVTARVPGRIVAVHFQEGDYVARGAPLLTIESPELAQARAARKTSAARLELARLNARRLETLVRRDLASKQEAALARAELASAEAQANAAEQTLTSYGLEPHNISGGARITLEAPINGHVLTRNAIFGQAVTAQTLLATLADFDTAYFEGRLFEKDLALVSPGSIAEVRLNAYPALPFVGEVASVGRQIDPVARTAVARVRIKDQNGALKAGLFGVAKLTAGDAVDRARTLAAPVTAVTQIGGRDVVFVHEPDGEFAVHTVTLGRSAAGKVQVLAGLNDAEQVVHNGVFVLKSAVLKTTFGEED